MEFLKHIAVGLDKLPLVSIITVTKNAGKHIEQTVESVLSQSYGNIEYIIVDGVSTDGTVETVRGYGSRISLFVSEPDGGIYDARNKGIALCKGELIGLLNASDYYERDAVENVVGAYLEDLEAGIFHGNVRMLNPDGTFFKLKRPAVDVGRLYEGMSLYHPTFFVRRSVYETCGMFSEAFKLSADFDFALRCFCAGIKFRYVDAVITNFRKGGVSSRRWEEACLECRLALIGNGLTEVEAEAAYCRMVRAERRNVFYERAYNMLKKTLPAGILDFLGERISVRKRSNTI
jgi:glycosyltransferase involved in cell wall biosynthesis